MRSRHIEVRLTSQRVRMTRFRHYWDYYKEAFEWPDSGMTPDWKATYQIYSDLGIPPDEAKALVESGYVSLHGDTIIDRYYGGELLSSDGVTRIHKNSFGEWYKAVRARE